MRDTMMKAREVWYMDAACQEEEDQDPLHVLSDTSQEAPDAQVEEESDREQVQMVLRLHFGMGEDDPMTLEEIGRRFSLTKERIRQIKEKALSKLRHPVRRMQLDPVLGV